MLNLLFNLIRAALMLLLIRLFPGFTGWIQSLTPGDIGHQVANTHTIFAVLAAVLEFPFAEAIVHLSRQVVPSLPEEGHAEEERKLHYLVSSGDLPSSVAIQQAKMELSRMGKIALKSLRTAVQCFFGQDPKLAENVFQAEETVDILTDKIQSRLIAFRSMDYSPKEASRLSQLMPLRQKLGSAGSLIRTVRNVGYVISSREANA